jgi:hypothetical protein
VLTPATKDCCSLGPNLSVGYGYYRWAGEVFSIRLSGKEPAAPQKPPATPELLELGGQKEEPFNYLFANPVLATISNPAKWLLKKNVAEATWSSTVSTNLSVDVRLAPSTWQFVAVDETMAESEILDIPLRQAEEVKKFQGGEGGNIKIGWNLIAVPWNVKLAPDAPPPPAGLWLFSDDPQQNVYVPAPEWTTGSAYWLFATEEFDGFSLVGETDDSAAVPALLAADTWHFMAWDDGLKDAPAWHFWRWDGAKFIYGAPAVPTDGVWGYKEPSE